MRTPRARLPHSVPLLDRAQSAASADIRNCRAWLELSWLGSAAALLASAVSAHAVVRGAVVRNPNGLRQSVVRIESSRGELCSRTVQHIPHLGREIGVAERLGDPDLPPAMMHMGVARVALVVSLSANRARVGCFGPFGARVDSRLRLLCCRLLSRGDPRHGHSPEWRFVEATQLARVQGRALAAQDVERGKPNLQMLTDGPLIKSAGRARQLDLHYIETVWGRGYVLRELEPQQMAS